MKQEQDQANPQADEMLTTAIVANMLDCSPGTLEVWRATKRYPLAFVKVGRSVRYRRSDVEKFIASRTVTA